MENDPSLTPPPKIWDFPYVSLFFFFKGSLRDYCRFVMNNFSVSQSLWFTITYSDNISNTTPIDNVMVLY